MKTFAYAGVSRKAGQLKLRFANDDKRFLVLVGAGHTEVEMIKLTKPCTKDEAVKELIVRNFDNGREEVTALLVGTAPGATITQPREVVVKVKKPVDTFMLTKAEREHLQRYWENNHIAPAMKKAQETI